MTAPRLGLRTLAAVGLLTPGVLGACGSNQTQGAGGSAVSGGTVDAGVGAPPGDASSATSFICPPLPDGGYMVNAGNGSGERSASGALTGSAVSCAICDVGAELGVTPAADGGPPTLVTLYLSNAFRGEDSCTVPGDASNAYFSGSIVLDDFDYNGGVYNSTQANTSNACTRLELSYGSPDTSTVVSNDAGRVSYVAQGPCDPLESAGSSGSWQVILNSVIQDPGDAGLPSGVVSYTVHGFLMATLVAEPAASATLWMPF